MSHTDEQMEQEIQDKGLEAPRVTLDQIKEMMTHVQYVFEQPEGTTSTFAHAFLNGDFYLATGHTACVSKENFDVLLGIKYAQEEAAQKAQDKLWELEGYNLYRNPMIECGTCESPKAELGEVLPEDPKEPSESEEGSKLCSGSAVGYSSTFTDPNLIAQLRECLGNRHIKSYGLHELVVTRLAKELGGSTDDIKVNSGVQKCANSCDTASSDTLAEASNRGLGELLPEHPWESIPTQQVLKYVGPVAFAYVWAVTSDQQDYWTCTISLHAAPEPVPEITANGITEEVAFAAAIRTLKEIVYKNEWVLG
ncbi:Gp49 family protein [Acinetobacter lwoffii]|uniref:YcaO domain-containing protein n=1 Tax=Acinetobacter lwoffii NCTC 5866 = CIP 64.10 = NIPH 512 TaxID=981327 RepID=A0ABN0Q029_ACILW|nr:Gp49 family protein [Acinetobacter lwoffii]ENU16705.1 hypothetical protein F995_02190 [Acinetobacter sp. CIP A162]ESJ96060.1 hypothetical protein P800_00882 [Acinetobacter lwoffii NCTC 5866 = CIP 64.10 = NIPH 512]QXB40427.1 hypothetical protein I6L23_14845 [Acinetobacter lwoffii]SUU30224.1 Uncharacterised protein [Acinetobacter lwoffii]VFQ38509.1 Uncharacterised protein [Acinetobacter lwoffii]